MVSKKSSKDSTGLGSLKREVLHRDSRSALTPSATESENVQLEERIGDLHEDINSNFTSLSDNINNKNKELSNNNSAILVAIKGCTDAIEEIVDTLEEYDETLTGINNNVYDISENIVRPFTDFINNINKKNNILNAIVPPDYFKDLHANIGMVSAAFNPTSTESYVSKVSSHLINIESGVYALAAAIWGWENVSEGNPVKSNIKDTNKDTYKPILETMNAVSKMIEENKKGANKSEYSGKAQSLFETDVAVYCDMMLGETASINKLVSDIKGLISSGTGNIVSSLLDIRHGITTLSTGKSVLKENKQNIAGTRVEALKQPTSSSTSNAINGTTTANLSDTKKSVENTIEIIKQLESLFDSKYAKGFFAGERNLKQIKRVFNVYKSSLLYIIEETKSLIEQTREVKGTESIRTVADTLSLLESVAGGFSDKEANDVKSNIQNVISVIGGNNNKDKATLFSLTDAVSTFATYLSEKSSDLSSIKSAYALVETISSIINKYNELSNSASVKTALALATKLTLFNFTNNRICLFADGLSSINIKEKTFDDFVKVSDRILTVLDTINGFSTKIDVKRALSLNIGVNKYSKLANRIVKMAMDVEESLSDIDEKQLNEICGKNSKLVKIGRLAKSLNEISASLSAGLAVGLIAQLSAKSANKTVENIVGIVGMLADKAFVSNLDIAVSGRESTTAKITLLSKSLFKILVEGTLFSTLAVPGLIGYALTEKSISAVVKIVKTLSELDKKDIDTAVDNLNVVKDITKTLTKVLADSIVLGVLAAPALAGLFTAYVVFKFGLVTVLSAVTSLFVSSTPVECKEAINSVAEITKSILKVCVFGAMLSVFAPLAISGFIAVLPALLAFVGVIALVKLVVGDGKTDTSSWTAVKGLGELVFALAGVMVIGGLLGGVVMKLLPNILVFTAALSMFILSVVGALSLATIVGGGLEHLKETASAIIAIVIASSMIMLVGGMIVKTYPDLIFNAFVFTTLLATFLFAVVGTIGLAGKLMKGTEKSLVYILAFETVTATCLLLPGYIMLKNPGLAGQIGIFLTEFAGMCAVLCGVARFISKREPSIAKAIPVMYAMSALMVAAGLTMIEVGIAAKLFNEAGGAAVASVLLAMSGVVAGIGLLSFEAQVADKNFNIKKGIAILGLLELVAAGAATVIWLINKVALSVNDWGQLWATVGTMAGIMTVFGTICSVLGSLSGVIFVGELVAAGLVAIVASMAIAFKILASATRDIVELSHSKLDINGIGQIISGMYRIAVELQGFAGLTWGIFTASLAIKAMSSVISNIAEAVQDAVNMHFTKYENGKKTGEFNLSEEDYVKAAKNTKAVVSVLGKAIIDIYNENPEIFTTGTILGDFIGTQTKFEKVCRSVSMLGKVISKIASSVQDAASLHYTKYENGKKVGEFNLSNGDFQRAAENTKQVIKTLGAAIMEAYDSNPDIFTTNGKSTGNTLLDTLGGIAGLFGADTKFGRVTNAVMTLGTLVSKISDGVSDMANLTVTEYDKNGKEKKRSMNTSDFAVAAANTNMIVTFLGNTIIDVYNKNPELFSSGNSITDTLGFNPKFKNIIDTVSALGGLMSSIAGGIQAMAENAVPVYGKDGKIIRKDPIKPSWYTQAATTVANVMTCMGNAIMSVYEQHPDWFAAQGMKSWFMSTSSSNTFTDVAKSLTMMAELIGKYADVVQKFASGKIDIYGPDGRVVDSVPITKNTYNAAAEAVTLCISTLSSSINKTYKDNKDLFGGDTFEPLMDSLTSVAALLGKYSEKVKDFANLTYDVYDESGNVIGKKHIGKAEFDTAVESVKSVISTMVTGIKDVYDKNPQLFKDTNADTNKKNSGKTWFEQIINSFLSVGPLISSISKAVQGYASLQVPEYDTNGRPTGRTVKMTEMHFNEAGRNIGIMVSLMASAIQSVWNNETQRQMFMNANSWISGQKDNSNPFYVISTAMVASGTMVEQSAKAMKAVLEIPGFENVNDIKKKLDVRIPVMTAALVHAVTESYKQGTDKTTGENIFDNALSDKSPFKKVEAGITAAYNVVMNAMKVYVEAGKLDMSVIDALTGGESADPKTNKIYKMVTGLAQPIVDIFNSTNAKDKDGNSLNYNTLFSSALGSDSYFTRIVNGVEAVTKIMGQVKSAYDQISSFDNDVDTVKDKINKMITGLADSIGTAYNSNKEAFDDAAPISGVLRKALTMSNPITGIISLFKGDEPDTPAMRVIKTLGTVCGIFDSIVKVYKDVATTKFDVTATPQKVTNMIQGLASVFNKDKMNGVDFDTAEDGAKMLKDFVEEVSDIMPGIFGVYSKLQQMKISSQQLASNMGLSLKRLVEGLVNAVNTPVNFDPNLVHSSFNVISDTVKSIIDIYTLPSKMLGPVMTQSNVTDIDGLINNVSQTIMAIPKKISELMSDTSGIMSDNTKMGRLLGSAWNMKRAMNNLGAAVSFIPTNTKDVEYFIPFINKLNKELSTIPKLDEFVRETDNLVRFNSSVNSLQVKNVEVLTKLFIEFNKFSSKFGNLDKFTQVLATKMSQCLTYLADQIRDSAKTINKSEQIQKKRQEQIRKTIEEFKKLADQGLEVTVRAAETETGSGFGGIGGDAGENIGQAGGSTVSSTPSVQSQSLGSGSTSHSNSTLQQIGSDVAQIARYYRSRQ